MARRMDEIVRAAHEAREVLMEENYYELVKETNFEPVLEDLVRVVIGYLVDKGGSLHPVNSLVEQLYVEIEKLVLTSSMSVYLATKVASEFRGQVDSGMVVATPVLDLTYVGSALVQLVNFPYHKEEESLILAMTNEYNFFSNKAKMIESLMELLACKVGMSREN